MSEQTHDHMHGCPHFAHENVTVEIQGDQKQITSKCSTCDAILGIVVEGCPHPTLVFLYFDNMPSEICMVCTKIMPLNESKIAPYAMNPVKQEIDQSAWVAIGVEQGWMTTAPE